MRPNHSDTRVEPAAERRHHRLRNSESGQATTEFALILLPLLILVGGIIYFGIGLNYWLDMNRVANQGARWAVVNSWPGCARTAAAGSCTATPACTAAPVNTSLINYLKCQTESQGLRNTVAIDICYPDDQDPATQAGTAGTPVRVTLQAPYDVAPIVGITSITLRARATMRLEQTTLPSSIGGHLSGVSGCTTP